MLTGNKINHSKHLKTTCGESFTVCARRKFEVLARIYVTHQSPCDMMCSWHPNQRLSQTDAIRYFTNPDNCLDYLAIRRWHNGVTCPTCGRKDVSFVPSRRVWQCKTRHPKAQFSIKTGTILEDSPLGLDKWLPVMWMVANCKNGVSSWEIHRALGVTQKTAWFMLHRIRLGMQTTSTVKIGGGPGGRSRSR